MLSIAQEILSAWMEWQAEKKSWKAEVSILAEIIQASMVPKAKSGWKSFHQLRNNLVLDVKDNNSAHIHTIGCRIQPNPMVPPTLDSA